MPVSVDQPLPIPFPTRGLDVGRGFGHQMPASAAVMTNVRVLDPSTYRYRGASRPGLVRYVAGRVPSGPHLIQELNEVVIADATALASDVDDPGTTTVDDPSSPGGPGSWGTGTLYTDLNLFNPNVSGATLGTRVPGYGGNAAQRRKGGSGKQPNKNKGGSSAPGSSNVGGAPGGGGGWFCTSVTAGYVAHVALPNIGGFDGQRPAFTATVCEFWQTVDESSFPDVVAANKRRLAAKADAYRSIVNQKNTYLATIRALGNPSPTLEFTGASVVTPNPLNVCNFNTANYCGDPRYSS